MIRRSVLLALLALLAPLTVAAPARAATKRCDIVEVLSQAVKGDTALEGYSLSCLYKAKAAADADPDLSTYTAVGSVLRAAILSAGGTPRPPATQVPTQPETGPSKTTTPGETAASGPTPTTTVVRSTAAVVGKPSGDGGDVPTPVIALGVVALAALVAAVSVELRRRRA